MTYPSFIEVFLEKLRRKDGKEEMVEMLEESLLAAFEGNFSEAISLKYLNSEFILKHFIRRDCTFQPEIAVPLKPSVIFSTYYPLVIKYMHETDFDREELNVLITSDYFRSNNSVIYLFQLHFYFKILYEIGDYFESLGDPHFKDLIHNHYKGTN